MDKELQCQMRSERVKNLKRAAYKSLLLLNHPSLSHISTLTGSRAITIVTHLTAPRLHSCQVYILHRTR